jgi:hypothetical protein
VFKTVKVSNYKNHNGILPFSGIGFVFGYISQWGSMVWKTKEKGEMQGCNNLDFPG